MNRAAFLAVSAAAGVTAQRPSEAFAAIERTTGGRLGVFALDTASGATLAYRATDRFPLASTFKLPLVTATLARVDRRAERLDRPVRIAPADVLNGTVLRPDPRGYVLPVERLCELAIIESDNTAANALLRALGGPRRLTAYVASTGVAPFRLDRAEPELNAVRPHDRRDTSTPAAMADFVRRLAAGSLVRPASSARLLGWMRAGRTGAARFRAGVPAGWRVAEKTGTSGSGADDVALLERPGRAPLVLAAYSRDCTAATAVQEAALASVARLAAAHFA